MFETALSKIKEYRRIIIHRHSSPDGDAIGSQVGLQQIILANFPEKEVFIVGDPAGRYSFIEGSGMDTVSDGQYEGALSVILDTSAAALISDARWSRAEEVLRIDHHLFCGQLARTEVIQTSYESCAGLIADFARECGLKVPAIAAKALFTGMVTDSGRFLYDSTSQDTFQRAAFLMKEGIDTGDIYRHLYSDDFHMIALRAKFTLKIRFTPNNVAYIYTDAEELAATGADAFSISRGMVGTMSNIRGVDIWVNFTETPAGVLCELRSGTTNINPVAVRFGGGGHEKASGATVSSRETAMQMLDALDALAAGNKDS